MEKYKFTKDGAVKFQDTLRFQKELEALGWKLENAPAKEKKGK